MATTKTKVILSPTGLMIAKSLSKQQLYIDSGPRTLSTVTELDMFNGLMVNL